MLLARTAVILRQAQIVGFRANKIACRYFQNEDDDNRSDWSDWRPLLLMVIFREDEGEMIYYL